MNKTFREIFKEEDHLAYNVAHRWGYQIKNISLLQKKQFKHIPPIITNMKVFKHTKDIQKTQRIIQLQKQIEQLRNQKVINKMREKKELYNDSQLFLREEKSQIIKRLQQKIDQYNYIVNHKHLAERSSDQARKVLKIGEKSAAQKILQKIKKQNSGFIHEDLSSQIKHNRQMTTLYKQYKQKLSSHIKNSKKAMLFNTIVSEPPNSSLTARKANMESLYYDENKNVSKQKNTHSDKLLNLNIPAQKLNNILAKQQFNLQSFGRNRILKNTFKKQFTQPNQFNSAAFYQKTQKNMNLYKQNSKILHDQSQQILQPFLNKSEFQIYLNLEKKNLNNKQVLQLYKFRINEYRTQFNQMYAKRHIKSKNKHKTVERQQGSTIRQQKIDKEQIKQTKQRSKSMMVEEKNSNNFQQRKNQTNQTEKYKFQNSLLKKQEEIQHYKIHQQENQNIYAYILKKKLNKIQSNAQKMKQNEIVKPKPQIKGSDTDKNIQNKHSKVKNLKNSNLELDYNEIAEQLDDDFYETIYKNEKFNLLTKRGDKK